MDELVGGVVGGSFAAGFVARVHRKRAAKNRQAQVLECAFRDRSGRTSRLLKRWRHGIARFDRGVITFEPFMPLGIRVKRPFTKPIRIPVQSIGQEVRDSTAPEAWYFRGVVRTLDTGHGEVEWGTAHTDDPAWAIASLAGAAPDRSQRTPPPGRYNPSRDT